MTIRSPYYLLKIFFASKFIINQFNEKRTETIYI